MKRPNSMKWVKTISAIYFMSFCHATGIISEESSVNNIFVSTESPSTKFSNIFN